MTCTPENQPEVPGSRVEQKHASPEEDHLASLAQVGSALPLERTGVLVDEERLNQLPSELDSQFEVTGRFYVYRGSGRTYECRDLLEIRRCHTAASAQADAVFVMMNPGSSAPLRDVVGASLSDALLVPTRPDTTQYQLMRLMAVMGWSRVKVLNLSDLRVTRSADFFELVVKFEKNEGHDGHSLFAKSRRRELLSALSRKDGAPIVAAWGVDKALRMLALRTQEALKQTSVVGLPHHNGPWAYRHPLPQNANAQACWRREALSLVRTDAATQQHTLLD